LINNFTTQNGDAIANGKISAAIQYQDSRGFVVYANDLYKSIASQVAQSSPEANKAIEASFVNLVNVWPTAIPPAQPVKTPEDVSKLVKSIEQNSQKVIDKTSTQAQQ